MSSRKGKWIKRIMVLAAIGGAGAWMAVGLEADPIAVEVAQTVRGPLVVTVDGTAKTRMRDTRTVFAPASGVLSRITLRPGDVVTQGQIVAEILPGLSQPLDARSRAETAARLAAAKAALAEAKRNVDRAKIAADLAKSEVTRTRFLVETNAAPRQSLEQAEANEKTAIADFELSKLAVERARLDAAAISVTLGDQITLGDQNSKAGKNKQERVEVQVPASGVVLKVYTESQGPVALGAPLIDIGDPSTVELAVNLPTQSAVRVSQGAKVTVDGMGDDKIRQGMVRLIEPAAYTKITALGVEEQRVDVIVTMQDPPPVPGDGFAADAHIEIQKINNVLKIPSGAVFRDGKNFAAFTVKQSHAKKIAINVIGRNADEVAVEGLTERDVVVIHPSDKLKDGVLVSRGL